MSIAKARKIQLGNSADQNKNFVLMVPDVQDGSLEIRRGNYDAPNTLLGKFKFDGTLVVPGLIGTVSQSNGIPTGAVIERGSNANGSYTKFADGTLICQREMPLGMVMTPASSIYMSDEYTWAYPATFSTAETPVVVSGNDNSSNQIWMVARSANNSGNISANALVRLYSHGSINTVRTVRLCAIGRWF